LESSKSGAYFMVKSFFQSQIAFFIFSSVFYCEFVKADFLIGLSTNSWQEKIPIVASGVEQNQMTTLSGLGVQAEYDHLVTQRIRYGLGASFISGSADIHQLKTTQLKGLRRNFKAYWLSNKLLWRMTKSFAFGPNVILNQRQLEGLSAAMSAGLLMDFEYALSENFRLTQSLGTMSDSSQLAYAIGFSYLF